MGHLIIQPCFQSIQSPAAHLDVDIDKAAVCHGNTGFVGSDLLGGALGPASHSPNQGCTKATQPPIT